jgi:hypothetical protein
MTMTKTTGLDVAGPRSERQKAANARRLLARQLTFELVAPLGGYYGLRAAGVSAGTALVVGGALIAPWIVYGVVRNRRLDVMAAFTLSMLLVGALMSAVTGDPRLLLVRDSWVGALLGLWILGTLPTQRPFIMATSRAVVVAKVGEAGADAWAARWTDDPAFRRDIRMLTAVWGVVFLGDALVRVVLAYSLPLDAVPGVSTAQWLVVLACLLVFHARYVSRTGLKV